MNFFLVSSLLLTSFVFANAAEAQKDTTTLNELKEDLDDLKKDLNIFTNTVTKLIQNAIASCSQASSSSSSSSPSTDSYVKPGHEQIRQYIEKFLKHQNNDNNNFDGLNKYRFPETFSFPFYVNGATQAGPSFLQAGAASQGAYTVAQPAPVSVQYQAQPAPVSVQYQAQPTPIQYNTQPVAAPVPAPVPVATYGSVQQVAVPAPAPVPVGGQYATAPSAQYVSAKKK